MDGETDLHVLDLHTMSDRRIDVQAMMPDSIQFIGVGTLLWCPYDNRKLLLDAVTLTDTVGTRQRFIYGRHLYLIDADHSTRADITPPIFDALGAKHGIWVHEWLRTSTPQTDSIFILYSDPKGPGPRAPQLMYILQHGVMEPSGYTETYGQLIHFKQSYDGRNYLGVFSSASSQDKLFLNDHSFSLPAASIKKVSWSPNGKKVALSVLPKHPGPKGTFEQIWIVDVDRILTEHPDTPAVDIIDLQMRFCMYSLLGCDAEFITDSTLAVSMHPDGASSCLWEISTTGRRIRQLTFLP